jgi:hypothetical protein
MDLGIPAVPGASAINVSVVGFPAFATIPAVAGYPVASGIPAVPGVPAITVTVADFPAFATVPVVASYPVALGVSAITVKDYGFPAFATVLLLLASLLFPIFLHLLHGNACWSPC